MRALQLALIWANWAGSAVFGWLQAPLWLLVPVAVWASFVFGATAAIQKYQVESGVTDSRYAQRMLLPNLNLIARNAGINFMIFAAGWIAATIFGMIT